MREQQHILARIKQRLKFGTYSRNVLGKSCQWKLGSANTGKFHDFRLISRFVENLTKGLECCGELPCTGDDENRRLR